jgi:hypothetical protein
MFRLARSSPALVEAHVEAERARHDLDASIGVAFARYEELEYRLRVFDGRLDRSRAHLREAGYLDADGFHPEFRGSQGQPGLMSGVLVRYRRHRASKRVAIAAGPSEITGRT